MSATAGKNGKMRVFMTALVETMRSALRSHLELELREVFGLHHRYERRAA
ncbi:hypothetical protein HNV27_33060 [Myxococcus xanthus]|nr:hypothetical protein [Myxococcus xanthus]